MHRAKHLQLLITIAASLLQTIQINAQTTDKIRGLLFSDNRPVEITVSDGIITAIEESKANMEDPFFLAPGFIDVQVNGFAGVSFTDDNLKVDQIRTATEGLWKEGVTTYLPTVITASKETIVQNLTVLRKALQDEWLSQSIPGFFLEGPYISPEDGFRGAHNLEYVRPPDWKEFEAFIEASGNHIIKTTLAPELEGAGEFIDQLRERNIIVAIGHHDANSNQIHDAARRGASISTHLGNGCANMIHRHNNPLWAQLSDDRLIPTIIADGFHLNPDELNVIYKVKGYQNLMLISDITKLAGLPPGEYDWNGKKVLLTPEGKLRLPDLDVLAGASFSIRKGVGNIMKATGCSLDEAIQMTSTNQSRIFGWQDRGALQVGKRADIIQFRIQEGEVRIHKTYLKGNLVYSAAH